MTAIYWPDFPVSPFDALNEGVPLESEGSYLVWENVADR